MSEPIGSALRSSQTNRDFPVDDPARPCASPLRTCEVDVETIPLPVVDSSRFVRDNAVQLGGATSVSARTQEQGKLDAHGAAIAASVAVRTPEQVKMDAYIEAFSGPYQVNGVIVRAPAQFRMKGGCNDTQACINAGGKPPIDFKRSPAKELLAICRRMNAPDPTLCLLGAGTARQIVAITQALIDAGTPLPGTGPLPDRIKQLQWSFGIGVDCTDFCASVAAKVAGKNVGEFPQAERPVPGIDYFADPPANKHLQAVNFKAAQTGDVFALDNPDPKQEVGHRAIVYSHTLCSPERTQELIGVYKGPCANFLGQPATSPDKVHEYQVDSSWGAGESGSPAGGVRRDTWLYNETTNRWAMIAPDVNKTPSTVRFIATPIGPKSELLHGVYRIK